MKIYLETFQKIQEVFLTQLEIKANKSVYKKDKVFVNLYKQLEDKNVYQKNNLPLVTPFFSQKRNVDHSTLYSISKPFDLVHGDIADTRFFGEIYC